jgi:hypothetical protein
MGPCPHQTAPPFVLIGAVHQVELEFQAAQIVLPLEQSRSKIPKPCGQHEVLVRVEKRGSPRVPIRCDVH